MGIVNPVQAAANRAIQKTRLGPRSRFMTGDTEVEYAKVSMYYGTFITSSSLGHILSEPSS